MRIDLFAVLGDLYAQNYALRAENAQLKEALDALNEAPEQEPTEGADEPTPEPISE